jgi:hypothetical protein
MRRIVADFYGAPFEFSTIEIGRLIGRHANTVRGLLAEEGVPIRSSCGNPTREVVENWRWRGEQARLWLCRDYVAGRLVHRSRDCPHGTCAGREWWGCGCPPCEAVPPAPTGASPYAWRLLGGQPRDVVSARAAEMRRRRMSGTTIATVLRIDIKIVSDLLAEHGMTLRKPNRKTAAHDSRDSGASISHAAGRSANLLKGLDLGCEA